MTGHRQGAEARWSAARQWFSKADDDLAVAGRCLAGRRPLVESAAFHCQQAIEKMLKGLLAAAGTVPPRIHDVGTLLPLVVSRYQSLGAPLSRIPAMTTWYIVSRYPDDLDPIGPSKQDVSATLRVARSLRRSIRRVDPVENES